MPFFAPTNRAGAKVKNQDRIDNTVIVSYRKAKPHSGENKRHVNATLLGNTSSD
jgi:hypothetical protein